MSAKTVGQRHLQSGEKDLKGQKRKSWKHSFFNYGNILIAM